MSHSLLVIKLSMNVLWLPVIILSSFMAGMLFRTAQLKKARKQVLSLETEMMRNHAEILALQKKQASTEKITPEIIAPVFPMKEQSNEEKDREVMPQQKKAK